MSTEHFELRSIGEVEIRRGQFFIKLNKDYAGALKEVEGFSHLQVYWWAHQCDSPEMREMTLLPKPYKKGPEEMGIFATRSPLRPNPLAMTLIPVIGVDHSRGELQIAYIDADPGTPVLDIKPYYGMERVKEFSLPQWCSHWPAWYEDAGLFDWAGEFENAQ